MQGILPWFLATAAAGAGLLALWLRAARRIADEDGVSWPRLLVLTVFWAALLWAGGERLMRASAQALGAAGEGGPRAPEVSSP